MRVLLISTLLYLAGIALVLYFRPALMFHKDGRWKEFSILEEEGTIFPFWAFCLVWAFGSFLVCSLVFSEGDGRGSPASVPQTLSATASLASASNSLTRHLQNNAFVEEPEEEEAPPPPSRSRSRRGAEDLVTPLPVPATERRRKTAMMPPQPFGQPGYYRLDEAASQRNGVPRYIYVGPELPPEAEETLESA